jgi:hypothetical protein
MPSHKRSSKLNTSRASNACRLEGLRRRNDVRLLL